MNTDEKILKVLEALQAGQTRLEHGQAHLTTAVEALKAGQDDIREHMATKQDVDIAVEGAKIELQSDIFTKFALIAREVQSHKKRITALEEKTGSMNPDKH